MPLFQPHRWSWRRGARCVLAVFGVGAGTLPARAGGLDFREMFASKWESVRDAFQTGDWEAYATGYAKHLPYGYQQNDRTRLNETTWGGGFGRTIRDDDGDRHSLFVMAFSDSHRAMQVNAGYGWQRYWSATRNVRVGAGYLAFVFSREDVASHFPLPAVLPCASVQFGGVEMIGLFVPRVSRDIKGDVLFLYLRVPLGGERPVMKRTGRFGKSNR
jgi:palmitoyl transferase